MRTEKLKKELDNLVQVPSLTNVWIMPSRTEIDMWRQAFKPPLGIKVPDRIWKEIGNISQQIEGCHQRMFRHASVYAERGPQVVALSIG